MDDGGLGRASRDAYEGALTRLIRVGLAIKVTVDAIRRGKQSQASPGSARTGAE